MRVLLTADTVGGVWTYALEVAAALAPHGVRLYLATMGAPLSPQQRRDADEIRNIQVFESSFKLEWMDDPWDDVRRTGDWLLGLENRLAPDVVHLNGYCHGALPWRAPSLVVGHSCVLSWWQAVKGEPAPSSWQRYADQVRQGLWGADLVVAPSQVMLAALIRHYGPLPRTRVIYNSRNPALFSPNTIKEPLVLTAGRLWDEAKNLAVLERVAPHLGWPVCVAGAEGHPGGGIASPRNVLPLGRLSSEEMRGWFARAAIYVHPSRYEPFGLSALEAGLSRCALVLGDIPSLREVWGDAALYVPPDDTSALKATLHELIVDPPHRQMLADQAMMRAHRYTPQRLAEAYLSAYQHIIHQRQGVQVRQSSQCAEPSASRPAYPYSG